MADTARKTADRVQNHKASQHSDARESASLASIGHSPALLRAAEAPPAQRVAAIAGMQRVVGNAQLERELAQQCGSEQNSDSTSPSAQATRPTTFARQRKLRHPALAPIQRQSHQSAAGTTTAIGDGPLHLRFFGVEYEIENRTRLAQWCGIMSNLAQEKWQDLNREAKNNYYMESAADDMYGLIHEWGIQMLFARSSIGKPNVSDHVLIEQIARLERRAHQIKVKIEQARVALHQEQIRESVAVAADIARHLQVQQERAIDQMRQAFRRGATNLAGQILEWTEKAAGLIGTLRDLDEALEGGWGTPRSIGREFLKELGTKALTLASLVANWASAPGLAADSERTIAKLQNVLSVAGVIPGPHTIIISYISPVLGGISTAMSRLIDTIRRENDTAIQVDPDLVRWGMEPGQRVTGKFMAAVMHAENLNDVPVPDPKVIEFFQHERGNFNDVMEQSKFGKPIPTRTLLWWLVNPERFRIWIFNHRQIVWQLLYGNRPETPLTVRE